MSSEINEECPSQFDDFAFCFSFLKKFGPNLSLPDVTLLSLEKFLSRETLNPDDPITNVHQQLVAMISRRPVTADNWPDVLGRMAYSSQVINDNDLEYEEYTIKERLALLKFLCESQFVRNQSFKHRLSKIPDGNSFWREEPVGLDKKGLRYWVLQDSSFSIRVYSEYKYLEYPFDYPQWTLLCGSLEQLLQLISTLSDDSTFKDSRRDDTMSNENLSKPDADQSKVKRTRGSVGNKKKAAIQQNVMNGKGCMICGKDTLYSKMLLCDGCDRECHTFCQYPILWTIPDTEWFCPSCRQVKLVESLSAIHHNLTQSKLTYEQSIEDKRRKIKRLARGGVLIENIIQEQQQQEVYEEEEEAPRRSGRSRKRIDYAELNELNIKMLQREYQDPVGGRKGTTTRGRSLFSSSVNASTSVVQHSRNTRRNKSYVMETDSSNLKKNASPVDSNVKEEVEGEVVGEKEEEESTCSRVQGFTNHLPSKINQNKSSSSDSFVCSVPIDYMKSHTPSTSLTTSVALVTNESPSSPPVESTRLSPLPYIPSAIKMTAPNSLPQQPNLSLSPSQATITVFDHVQKQSDKEFDSDIRTSNTKHVAIDKFTNSGIISSSSLEMKDSLKQHIPILSNGDDPSIISDINSMELESSNICKENV